MIQWILTNLLLTLLALAFVKMNPGCPHRLRFHVCFAALCGWLVPWNAVARWLPAIALWPGAAVVPWAGRIRSEAASGPAAAGAEGYPGVGPVAAFIAGNADTLLVVATTIGALLFAASCVRYRRLVERLALGSTCGRHLWSREGIERDEAARGNPPPPLRIQDHVPGAFTTGIVRPTIWIHEALLDHPALSAALIHEHRHVRNGDNVYLWVTTLAEKLLWWNPVLRYLATHTRRLQELSCDEACARDWPTYELMLKQLVLTLSKARGARAHPQVASVHGTSSFNVRRIQALGRKYTMKARHYMGIGLLLVGSTVAFGWAAAQSEDGADNETVAVSGRDIPEQVLEAMPGFGTDVSLEEADRAHRSLQYYTMLLERQFDRLQAEHKALQREVEALQAAPSETQQ